MHKYERICHVLLDEVPYICTCEILATRCRMMVYIYIFMYPALGKLLT